MPSNNAIARARTLCICGSRSFADYGLLCRSIDAALVEWDPSDISQVVHGGALGADRLGGRWARERGLRVVRFDRKRSPIHLETQTDLIGELRSASFYDREQGLKQL